MMIPISWLNGSVQNFHISKDADKADATVLPSASEKYSTLLVLNNWNQGAVSI